MEEREVLKLARKTLALCSDHPWRSQAIAELDKLIEQKSNALAQPEQEPVAWIYEDELPESYPYDAMFEKSRVIDGVRMFPQIKNLKHEPVLIVEKEPAYMSQGHYYEGTKPHIDPTKVWKLAIGTKLYTTPPQRKPWVSLSDEDIERIAKKARSKDHAITLAMRELKEKNT